MFVTPAKPAMATPLARAASAGKWSALACATPRDEEALLRQLSSVMKEHIDTVTKSANRCAGGARPPRAAGRCAHHKLLS